MKKLKILTFIFVLLVLFFFFYQNIIYPSINSVIASCSPEVAEEKGIIPLAQTEVIYSNETMRYESKITYFVEPDKRIIKHERCHIAQERRIIWFINSCDHQIQKTLREMECYNSEYLPDFFWEFYYKQEIKK